MRVSTTVLVALLACSAHEARPLPAKLARSVPADAAALGAPSFRLPDGVTPLAYDLRLELDPNSEAFHGAVTIRTRIDAPTDHVWIHADELTITDATFDGTPLALLATTGDQMRGFGFGHVIANQTITLAFEFSGHTLKDEEGLFRQEADHRWYLFSQGESVFARRITPCFDEPRFKTPWKVTLVVPDDLVALGNMPQVRETKRPDRRKEIELAVTPPMPSYLLAVAVGPFELVDARTVGRNKVPVRVVVERGDADRAHVVMAKLPAVVTALETYLDDPLPWPKLDLVAVPHLFGAMENPGLITFDAKMLLADGDRRSFGQHFVHLAAHELAHQWFGNLVTPAWWNDLWLSEGFASWLSDKVAVGLGAFDDPTLRGAIQREQGLEADGDPSAKSLRRTISRNDDPDHAFDAIAYEKGAAVLATFERWIGEDKFREALRGYLRAHRDATATSEDVVSAIATVSGLDTARAFSAYIEHAGAPIVEISLSCEGAPKLIAHARSIAVPMCVGYPTARGLVRSCALAAERTELALTECPAWVNGNDGAGYYDVVQSIARPPIARLALADRIAFGDDIAASFSRGDSTVTDALRDLAALAKASDPYALHGAAVIAKVIDPVVDDATRPAWTAWLAARFATRLAPRSLVSPATLADRQVRDDLLALVPDRIPTPAARLARRLIDESISHHEGIDPDLVAIAAGQGGRDLFEQLATLVETAPDLEVREAGLEALGSFSSDLVERAIDVMLAGTTTSRWFVVGGYFDRSATRTAAWRAVRARLPAILARLTGVQAGEVIEATGSLCDTTTRGEVVAALEPHLADIFDGRRLLDRSIAAIDRCIGLRARAGDIAAALK